METPITIDTTTNAENEKLEKSGFFDLCECYG